MDLTRYDTIVLSDASALTVKQLALFEEYVSRGRGLIVFPRHDASATPHVSTSQPVGQELLPARLGKLITPTNKETPFTFDARRFEHPLLKSFQGNSNAAFESTLTFHFIDLVPAADAAVCLWFNDGHPALVEHQFGAGRVILSATSADVSQGNWAFYGHSFVPLIHETVLFSLGDQDSATRRLLVGQPLISTRAIHLIDRDCVVVLPNGESRLVQSVEQKNVAVSHFEETHHAGIYTFQMTDAATHTQYYSVNVNIADCDLSPLTQQHDTHAAITQAAFDSNKQTDSLSTHREITLRSILDDLTRQVAFFVLALLLVEHFSHLAVRGA